MHRKTWLYFWLWARFLFTILLLIGIGTFLVCDLEGWIQPDSALLLWIAAGSLILIWMGITWVRPWVANKQKQRLKRWVDNHL